MARNISFALTTEQFRDQTKTVTRRLGWLKLKVGDELMGCVKCMGLKPGEAIERLGLILVIAVRRERLDRMATDPRYGKREAAAEGFPEMTGFEFVKMFCENMGCVPADEVTRIEFRYVKEKPKCCCGAWADPDDYPDGNWDRSEDWCPVHGVGSQNP